MHERPQPEKKKKWAASLWGSLIWERYVGTASGEMSWRGWERSLGSQTRRSRRSAEFYTDYLHFYSRNDSHFTKCLLILNIPKTIIQYIHI